MIIVFRSIWPASSETDVAVIVVTRVPAAMPAFFSRQGKELLFVQASSGVQLA
jgi:hypothetical protein